MKRIPALFLALVLCFTLAACGGTPNAKPTEAPEKTSAPTQTSAPTETPAPTEVPAPTETPAPEKISLSGVWECIDASLTEAGNVTKAEELVSLYDMALKDMFSVTIYPDNQAEIVYMGDDVLTQYQKTDSGFLFTALNEAGEAELELTATFADEKLTFTMEESYTSDGQEIVSEMAYVLKRTGDVSSRFVEGYDLMLSGDEVQKMSNFINQQYYLKVDQVLYGWFNKADFGRANVSVQDQNVTLEDSKVIAKDCDISRLCTEGEYLYGCLNVYGSSSDQGIVRMKLGSDTLETIYDKTCNYLQILNGKLYFTDENHRFCSMNLDGSEKTIVLDKESYYTYLLNEEWLLYQDDDDQETIHLYNLNTQNDTRLTDKQSYHPIICEGFLYYLTSEKHDIYDYTLCRVGLYSGKQDVTDDMGYRETFFINGEKIFYHHAGCPSLPVDKWDKLYEKFPDGFYSEALYMDGDIQILLWDSFDEVDKKCYAHEGENREKYAGLVIE